MVRVKCEVRPGLIRTDMTADVGDNYERQIADGSRPIIGLTRYREEGARRTAELTPVRTPQEKKQRQ